MNQVSEAEEIYAALERMQLIRVGDRPTLEPLTGGVSSEIYRVQLEGQSICVKRALPQLRVKQEWLAPVERGRYEVSWFRVVREIAPDIVPPVLAVDPEAHLFAMPFLPPAEHPVWKQQLLDGVVDPDFAGEVGRYLGLIHRTTAGDARIAEEFDNDYIFGSDSRRSVPASDRQGASGMRRRASRARPSNP